MIAENLGQATGHVLVMSILSDSDTEERAQWSLYDQSAKRSLQKLRVASRLIPSISSIGIVPHRSGRLWESEVLHVIQEVTAQLLQTNQPT